MLRNYGSLSKINLAPAQCPWKIIIPVRINILFVEHLHYLWQASIHGYFNLEYCLKIVSFYFFILLGFKDVCKCYELQWLNY